MEPKTLTLKELKSRLDDNEMDLSMNSLTDVPAKELATLKRATILDLSCNRLVGLPVEFCSITQLTKLDLSQNALECLPERFGNLVNLVHLDLYKNQLEFLPLSFSHLKKLKWLDVKDNPLTANLEKVAGDCLDAKQCQAAATKVVKYLGEIERDQERERQKRLKAEREKRAQKEAEEAKLKKQGDEAKKRERERRKQQNKNKKEQTAANDGRFAERMSSLITFMMRMTLYLTFVFAFSAVFFGGFMLWNCERRVNDKPQLFVPHSQNLCKDFNGFLVNRTNIRKESVYEALTGVREIVYDGSMKLADTLRNYDYAQGANDAWEWTQKTAAATQKWIQNESGPAWRRFSKNAQYYGNIALEQGAIFARWSMKMIIKYSGIAWELAQYYFEAGMVLARQAQTYVNQRIAEYNKA